MERRNRLQEMSRSLRPRQKRKQDPMRDLVQKTVRGRLNPDPGRGTGLQVGNGPDLVL
jgi:hypothetical protein